MNRPLPAAVRRWCRQRPTAVLASLLTSLLALAGCASLLPPRAVAPATIALPANWSASAAAGGAAPGSDGAGLAAWWQRFDDPVLASLVGQALQANTSINGALAALQQAQALREVAAAALSPTLGSSASAQRGMAADRSTGNALSLGLNGQWLPDVFGATRAGISASDATLAASAASLGDMQVQISAELALDYILLRSAQARLAIARDNLASQQETLQITLWRQQAGLLTALEAEQAQTAVAQTSALLPALQTSIVQTAHALAVLTGRAPADGLALTALPDGNSAATVPLARDGLQLAIPADTLRQRADVRATEFQVAAALAKVDQAQAQRWPSFSIGGSLGANAATLGALGNSAALLGSVLASVSWSLLDGGAAQAQVRVQQAALAQAQQVYRAAVLGALKDVEDALTALNGDRQRLLNLRQAAQAAGNAAQLARQRYSSGLVDFQTVLDTQRSQLSAQDSVVSASADLANDQVRLFKSLGGGWRDSALAGATTTSPDGDSAVARTTRP